MKNMRKLTILPLLILGVILSSCSKNNNEPYFGYTVVTSISSMDHVTNTTSVQQFEYVQYDKNFNPMPIIGGKVTSIPILSRQKISNKDVSEISYSYTDKMKYLTVDIKSINGDKQEKYELDELFMAKAKLVGETYVALENIKYDTKGFRTFYNGFNLFSESGTYTRVEKGSNIVATYEYTPFLNPMGFQQLNIPGEEFLNVCDHFGKQSRHYLSRATIKEEGVTVVYEYNYAFDPYGYISLERISKDGKPYITREYTYASVTVENSPETL